MSNERKMITKEDWVSNFTLIGKPKINKDYTYGIDERGKNNTNFVYNTLNIGIDCGEKYGVVYAEMMGGYNENSNNIIYAHGKDDDDRDDYDNKIEVAWEDRFDDSILETIGNGCFITVGLETTTKDNKTFYKKFLSAYDAIVYIQEHLTEDMTVNVKGKLKYSMYNDVVQVRKTITSIALSKAEPDKHCAKFTQSVLLDKDSVNIKNCDKDKGVLYVDATVLDYLKELDGVEIKTQFPFRKQFEFPVDFDNPKQIKIILDKIFKVKKNYTQITFDGEIICGGATTQVSLNDLDDDLREELMALIEAGVYTEEEAIASVSTRGSKEQRMVLRKPIVRLVGDDKTPVLQKFEDRYTEDDLAFDLNTDDTDVDDSTSESVDLEEFLNSL